MLLVLISVLTIVVVGAICFWAIDKFANNRRLANLLKTARRARLPWSYRAADSADDLLARADIQ